MGWVAMGKRDHRLLMPFGALYRVTRENGSAWRVTLRWHGETRVLREGLATADEGRRHAEASYFDCDPCVHLD